MSWSSQQYLAFEAERTRPVADLLHAVPRRPARLAVDLGCGPGNSTELLAAHFPDAEIIGIDSSQDMIAAARKRLPRISFNLADITAWDAPGPFDAILANAVLQWVPDHATLLPRLLAKLSSGGNLAVQMPINFEEPVHRLMRDIAAEPRWAAKLADANSERTTVQSPDWYFGLLQPRCRKVDMWCTTYFHHLVGGADAIVEWLKGSGLRPFLARLDGAEQADYLSQYRSAVAKAYPALPDGSVLLPFPRLFIVATR